MVYKYNEQNGSIIYYFVTTIGQVVTVESNINSLKLKIIVHTHGIVSITKYENRLYLLNKHGELFMINLYTNIYNNMIITAKYMKKVCANENNIISLNILGRVYGSGKNDHHQLNKAKIREYDNNILITEGIEDIGCCEQYNIFLTTKQTVYIIGRTQRPMFKKLNTTRQFLDQEFTNLLPIKSIHCGKNHSALIFQDNSAMFLTIDIPESILKNVSDISIDKRTDTILITSMNGKIYCFDNKYKILTLDKNNIVQGFKYFKDNIPNLQYYCEEYIKTHKSRYMNQEMNKIGRYLLDKRNKNRVRKHLIYSTN